MRKKPVVYLLVILPILWIGALASVIALVHLYSEITGTPRSAVPRMNGLLIGLPAFFLWIPIGLLIANVVVRSIRPLRRIAEQYVAEANAPGFAESQIAILKLLLVVALICVPLILLGFFL